MRNGTARRPLLLLVGGLMLQALFGSCAHAMAIGPNWQYAQWGYVLARTVVLDDAGHPTWVEVDPTIADVNERQIPIPLNVPPDALTMGVADYRLWAATFRDLDAAHDPLWKGRQILGREAYNSLVQSPDGLGTVDVADADPTKPPQKVPVKPAPITDPGIKSVVVRSLATIADPRLLADDDIVLHRSGIDLNRIHPAADPGGDSESLLLNPAGQVLYASKHAIALKSAYFNPEVASTRDRMGFSASTDAKVLQGFPGVRVTNPLDPRTTVTNDKGGYQARYFLVPCPCFPRMEDSLLTYEVPYKNFNPKNRNPLATYTVMRQTYETCIPDNAAMCFAGGGLMGLLVGLNVQAIYATMATPAQTRLDIRLSSFLLTGTGTLANGAGAPVELGAATTWDDAPSAQTPATFDFDFDGDGIVDAAVDGTLDDQAGQRFIWLGGKTPTPDPETHRWIGYDLQREADSRIDLVPHGRLKTITREDLAQTDLYIFRDSTGELITERIGLNPQETSATDQGAIDREGDTPAFYYKALMRGPTFNETGRTNGSLAQWHTQADIKLDYYGGNQIDALQPGELVTLVAINRPTGYVGRATVPLHYRGDATQATGLDVPLPELVLGPPQLRIHAERQTAVAAGLTQGDPRTTRIGSEGAGLTTDTYISLSTEWTDATGKPLPAELSGYGYSGTLAKITGPNQLSQDQGCGSALSTLDLGPGLKRQLIKLSGGCDLASEHYYLYVCGWPAERPERSRCFDFQNGRPKARVPVQVALYDEDATQKLLVQEHRNENAGTDKDPKTDTLPRYVWVTRPEFEFSVFDFKPTAINKTDADGNTTNILNDATPVIASSDQLLEILYSLSAPGGGNPLDLLDPTYSADAQATRGLILALGDTEIPVTLQNGVLREADCPDTPNGPAVQGASFCTLEAFAQLDASDYLTLRLYANGDSANVLWEWAFAFPSLEVPSVPAEVSADTPSVPLSIFFPSALPEPERDRYPISVQWTVQGAGGVLDAQRETRTGVPFENRLTTTSHAGDSFTVTARVTSSNDKTIPIGTEKTFGPFLVVPGEPAKINYVSGAVQMPADGYAQSHYVFEVRDNNNNFVDDGTPIGLSIEGDLDHMVDSGSSGAFTGPDGLSVSGGLVQADIRAGAVEGMHTLALSAPGAGVLNTLPVELTPIAVTLSPAAVQLQAGSGPPATLTVQITGATPGAPVEWVSTLGTLEGSATVSSQRDAQATLTDTGVAGEGTILVRVGGHRAIASITITSPLNAGITVTPRLPAIVGDRTQDGTQTVETVYSGDRQISYVTRTAVDIAGLQPNQTAQLRLGTPLSPNAEPSLEYPLQAVSSGQTLSIDGQHAGMTVGSITVADDDLGLELQKDAYLMLQTDASVSVPDALFASIDFRPKDVDTSSWQPISTGYKRGPPILRQGSDSGFSYRIDLVEIDGQVRIEALATTDNGIVSVQHPQAIQAQTWYSAAIRYHNGALELEVRPRGQALSSGVATIAATGALKYTDQPVLIGQDFEGTVTRFQTGTETPNRQIVQWDGGQGSTSVTADAQGSAALDVSSTGRLTRFGRSVGFALIDPGSDTAFYQPLSKRTTSRSLSGLVGALTPIAKAQAQVVPGTAKLYYAISSGLQVASAETWGWFGSVVQTMDILAPGSVDFIKSTSHVVSEIVGIGDFITVAREVAKMCDGHWKDVQYVELTFAAAGALLTGLQIVTAGAASPVVEPLQLGLKGLKLVLKGALATKSGVLGMAKGFGQIFRRVIQNPAAAKELMQATAEALVELTQNAAQPIFKTFMSSVKTGEDFVHWIRARRYLNKLCAVPVADALGAAPFGWDWRRTTAVALLSMLGTDAYAASNCFSNLFMFYHQRIDDLVAAGKVPADDAGRLHAFLNESISKDVVEAITLEDGLPLTLSDGAIDGIIAIARYGREAKNLMYTARSIARTSLSAADRIKQINAHLERLGRLIKADVEVGAKFNADLGKYANDSDGFLKGTFYQVETWDRLSSKLGPGVVLESKIPPGGAISKGDRFIDLHIPIDQTGSPLRGLRVENKNWTNYREVKQLDGLYGGWERDIVQVVAERDITRAEDLIEGISRIRVAFRGPVGDGALDMVKAMRQKGEDALMLALERRNARKSIADAVLKAYRERMDKVINAVESAGGTAVGKIDDVTDDAALAVIFEGKTSQYAP